MPTANLLHFGDMKFVSWISVKLMQLGGLREEKLTRRQVDDFSHIEKKAENNDHHLVCILSKK